ncbi:hypothetical protein B0A48_03227 [Cryoendolithus antarcticus]|uniref:Uncharacterized protein n=1 Tax=Cryoendolithus antarcticus TaxID=1507870 RepID=A0A1V8TJE4_9PEZI|nr:hypothetical protein B0A48_03227 [Cryoendolithus antarcticus]
MQWPQTGFPTTCLESSVHKIALSDFVTRAAAGFIRKRHLDRDAASGGGWASPKGGAFNINAPGQEVLPRTSAIISGNETIELRFTVNLPVAGRSYLGKQAHQILVVNLMRLVQETLPHRNVIQVALEAHVLSVIEQHRLRQQLRGRNLISFIANGSILPRSSDAGAKPMAGDDLVTFQSPPELESTMQLGDGTTLCGMGIPKGITVLTGGGFHDGGELVVTDSTAVKSTGQDPVHDPSKAPPGIDLQSIDQLIGDGQAKFLAICLNRFAEDTISDAVNLNDLLDRPET